MKHSEMPIQQRWNLANPPLIIAEAGVNHNGSLHKAHLLIDAAADAGADFVKFQIINTASLVTNNAPAADYQTRNLDHPNLKQARMLKQLELSPSDFATLKAYCQTRDIGFLATPFDTSGADWLNQQQAPAIKIGSGDVTNLPLLIHIAKMNRPMILSTGMANHEEIADALKIISQNGNPPIALMHCVSCYPARFEDLNLKAILTLKQAFSHPVGFSDHSPGILAAPAAIAAGASFIEKHLTLSRDMQGPDHAASIEPDEFRQMVTNCREIAKAMGDGVKQPTSEEINTARVARRSLVAACPLKQGTRLKAEHIAIKRPGTGLPPNLLDKILGKTLRQDIAQDTLLSLEQLSSELNQEQHHESH